MDRSSKRHLMDIAKHVPYEEMKARKQAGKARRALRKGKGEVREQRVTEDNWEELLDQHGHAKRRPSIDELVKQIREDTPRREVEVGAENAAIVMSVASGRCRVFRDGAELDAVVPPEIAVRQKSALAVGDRVIISGEPGVAPPTAAAAAVVGPTLRVQSVLPRRSVLARPDPLHKHVQRLIAANVDVVIHVVSVKAPPLRPRLIDRFLIAIQRGGARPVICVNKIDLIDAEERELELEKLAPYLELDVPIIGCSTRTGEGLDALRDQVQGRMAALVGHSGVGKSSILNALDSSLELATNTLQKRGTGRHTTSASTLYDFGGGTLLIDTPGIREFGLWDLDRDSLRDYFPEFTEPAESCRFTNCTHVHEPDCEVKERVERGELHPARYETYVRLWNDLT